MASPSRSRSCYLAGEPGGPAAALDLADLAIIGTIADVAPIVGENLAIARLGLARLRTAPRPGIAALLAAAGVAPQRVDLARIGFALAPRLNAGGRMGDVATAANLLLATDAASANELAGRLEASNRERRDLTATVLDEAHAAVADLPPGPVIITGAWPVGIIGLVAGRLAEDRGAPAIVVATGAEPWRASGRGRPAASWRRPSRRAPTSSSAMAATRRPPGASSRRTSTRPCGSASCRSSPSRPGRAAGGHGPQDAAP